MVYEEHTWPTLQHVGASTLRWSCPADEQVPDVTATLYRSYDLLGWSPFGVLPRPVAGRVEIDVPTGDDERAFYHLRLDVPASEAP
jgi:hypothetical protein